MNKVKIIIGKKPFDFHFGLGFFGELKDNQGIGIEDIEIRLKENPFKLVPVLMLEAAKYSAKRRGTEVNFTEYTFVDAIDDDGGVSSESFLDFLTAFTDSMTKDVPQEKEVPKKKTTKRRK